MPERDATYLLDTVDGLRESLAAAFEGKPWNGTTGEATGELYCPRCGDYRRMSVESILQPRPVEPGRAQIFQLSFERDFVGSYMPWLLQYTCLQCECLFTGVVHCGTDGIDIVVLPSAPGGVTTPRTPAAVAYYLDQAHRSHTVGANSAAIAMYRSAMEHLLHEQGFHVGMLGKKINDLEVAIKNEEAPKWAQDLAPAFLTVLKALGNAALHTNEGDVTKQAVFDGELIGRVQVTVIHLLQEVYEKPVEAAERLAALQAVAESFEA